MDLEQAIAFTDALVFAKSGAHLSDLQQIMLRESWSLQRQSYDQIAETFGYSATYLKHDVGPKLWHLLSSVLDEKVTKTSFRSAIERCFQASSTEVKPIELAQPDSKVTQQDWEEQIDVNFFYGRQAELSQLQQWILSDRCRLVTILGMGGMGKTTLTAKLTQQIQPQFEKVIWRSLRNVPPLQDLLTEIIQFLSPQAEIDSSDNIDDRISRLLQELRSQRCLLIFDNVETVLSSRDQSYSDLFKQIASTTHQSCLVLTSREKPQAVSLLEGALLPVRCLLLAGLDAREGQEIFRTKGAFEASSEDWNRLTEAYSGNPLALKIISTTIQALFNGSVSDFLQQDTFVFGNIRTLLDQQFEQLSDSEIIVIRWLAVYRDSACFTELQADIFPPMIPSALIEAFELLIHRSLVEKGAGRFWLQPVVMEYVTEFIIDRVVQDLQSNLDLLKSHALLQTQAKDYIREAQVRLILQPILNRLQRDLSRQIRIEVFLAETLKTLRHKPGVDVGYAGGNILNLLCQLCPDLHHHNFSHLTLWQAYLKNTHLYEINFSECDLSRSVFADSLSTVFSVAFSANGALLATGDAEGRVQFWETRTGALHSTLVGHVGWVWSVAFSPDGQMLASVSNDQTIRLWDLQTGQCLKILEDQSGSIWSVAFSPNGQMLATGGDQSSVKLWDVNTGSCYRQFAGHAGRILSVTFSSDQTMLASSSDDLTIKLWSLQTGDCLQTLEGHTNHVWSVVFSPDGQMLASGSADRSIKLWRNTGECLNTFQEHRDRIRSIQFSPDAQMLVSASDDQTVRLWQVHTGQCVNILRGHTSGVFSVSFHPDNQTIASGSTDQSVRIWNAHTGRCFRTIKGYSDAVLSISFDRGGQQIASGGTDQIARIWDVETGACLQQLSGHSGWVTSVAFHPDGQWLATSSVDRTIRFWNLRTGQCDQVLRGHLNWVQSIVFSPNGDWLASSSDDQTVRLWSAQTAKTIQVLQGHSGWVWAVRFSPDGKLLASSSEDQTVRLWSPDTGECLQTLVGHSSRVQSIAFSLDASVAESEIRGIIASGSGDATVRLWSLKTGRCLQVLLGHHNSVWSVAFDSSGEILASASLDQTVRLWDIKTGTCLKVLPILTNPVRTPMSFRPSCDQSVLASGNHDGSVQLWNTQTGQCSDRFVPNKPYQGTQITNITGITLAQKSALKALGATGFQGVVGDTQTSEMNP